MAHNHAYRRSQIAHLLLLLRRRRSSSTLFLLALAVLQLALRLLAQLRLLLLLLLLLLRRLRDSHVLHILVLPVVQHILLLHLLILPVIQHLLLFHDWLFFGLRLHFFLRLLFLRLLLLLLLLRQHCTHHLHLDAVLRVLLLLLRRTVRSLLLLTLLLQTLLLLLLRLLSGNALLLLALQTLLLLNAASLLLLLATTLHVRLDSQGGSRQLRGRGLLFSLLLLSALSTRRGSILLLLQFAFSGRLFPSCIRSGLLLLVLLLSSRWSRLRRKRVQERSRGIIHVGEILQLNGWLLFRSRLLRLFLWRFWDCLFESLRF